jgi:flagellar biosynthesis GTPase FlhF
MSVSSTSSFHSATDLGKRVELADATLVERLRAATAKKAETALKKEAEKAEKAAAKEAEKAEKAAVKEAEKAAKAAEKAAAKEAEKAEKAAEKALKKAADAALKESAPKRPVGRPTKKAAGGAGSSTTSSSMFDDMREPIPAITPAMRKRISARDSVDLEIYPTLFSSPESHSPEELIAENARLREHLAAISEAYSRQRAVIVGSMELLSAASH